MVMDAVIFSDLLPFFIRSTATDPSLSLTLILILLNSMHTTGDAIEKRTARNQCIYLIMECGTLLT